MSEQTSTGPWRDLQAYVGLPRLTGLTLGPAGEVLVAVSTLDDERTGSRTAWWRVDPDGVGEPRRWTRAVEGEGEATFTADGRLLFTSTRPVAKPADDEGPDAGERHAVWCLPAGGGEAYPLVERAGGWTSLTAARGRDRVLLGADLMRGSSDLPTDRTARAERRKRKVSAVLHEGSPVRHWDHDLGPEQPQLLRLDLDGVDGPVPAGTPQTLLEHPGRSLASRPSLSADGRLAALTWETPGRHGEVRSAIALLDLDAPGSPPRILAGPYGPHDYSAPLLSADGSTVVGVRSTRGTAAEPMDAVLWVVDVATGEGRPLAPDWDRWGHPAALAADGATVWVVADDHGHAPVFAVDVASGEVSRLTTDGAHGHVELSADGRTLYALRSSYTDPGSLVAIDVASGLEQSVRTPVEHPALPGRTEELTVTVADGTEVRALLVLPEGASAQDPAPLVLWAHGGPFSTWNSWSWRWCPWLLAADGYAVLLPDPGLSTGYGRAMVARGWTHWGDEPYTDLMAVTDAVEQRADVDATRTAMMGGSYGGYLANWIASHTDRFRAIVSHAGLWNLEAFLATTDGPSHWVAELTPEFRRRCSPHRFADAITTPMLVVHGDRDYRVPIVEGLGLWWDLVSRFDGAPEDLPHKLLVFPDENHWVLAPQHAVVWYETVLGFLDLHVRNGNFVRPAAL